MVPNLDIIYSSTLTIWTLNNQGLKAYAIARMGVDKQTYLKDYLYECSYVNSGYTMTRNYYKFPNEWIIDAVNISNKAQYVWNVVDPSLDMGFTYCGGRSQATKTDTTKVSAGKYFPPLLTDARY